MNWLSLLVPFAYLGILLTSLATFSSLYRKRKAQKSHSLAPYFPPHTARNIYLSLLHLQDHEQDPSSSSSPSGTSAGKPATTSTKVPDSLLRAALLTRCTENIHRIIHVRTRKQALSGLLKKGCVGDEIWERLLRAEQELEEEVKDCVQEANAFSQNWGTTIFQSANEMANNDMLKKRLEGIFTTAPAEKAAWDAKREGSLRELEGTTNPSATSGTGSGSGSTSAGLAIKSPAPTDTTGGRDLSVHAKGLGSSDEDGVFVEKGEEALAGGAGGGAGGAGGAGAGTGKSKKKKNKK